MKSTRLILPILAAAFHLADKANSQEIIYADEYYGPHHISFYDRGYYEEIYSGMGYNAIPTQSQISQFGLTPYLNPDGSLQDGVHVFYHSGTGAIAFILPPGLNRAQEDAYIQTLALVNTLESSISSPDPQQDSLRTSSTLRAKGQTRMSGISAGDKYVIPEAATPGGTRNAFYSEYNYVDIGTDRLGVGNSGNINVYSVGYEHILNDNLFLDISYEYGDESLRQAGGSVDVDTHTVAGAISSVLVNNLFGMLIVGGSFSDGGTTVGGVQLANADGEIFFVNPGLGTNWVLGNLILDGGVSYLFQDASTTTTVAGTRFGANNELSQVIIEAGARYNITDTLYARVGLQYNNIIDEDFGAGVLLDKNWLQINSEIGIELANGIDVYVGHAYDAGHKIYDTHTARAGISYSF